MPQKGYLLTTDVRAKQLILLLNESQSKDGKFILADLDDTHVFIDTNFKDWLMREVESKLENFVRYESSI